MTRARKWKANCCEAVPARFPGMMRFKSTLHRGYTTHDGIHNIARRQLYGLIAHYPPVTKPPLEPRISVHIHHRHRDHDTTKRRAVKLPEESVYDGDELVV
jgi:hypothetical protein